MTQRHFIVCYDSPNDGRRAALSRLLGGWGARVQWSVFECVLLPGELTRMLRSLQAVVDHDEDSVFVYQCAARGLPDHAAMGPQNHDPGGFWLA